MDAHIKAELDRALELEIEWTKRLESGNCGDSGNYCESASREYVAAAAIRKLYRNLHDDLLAYGRMYS